MIHLLGIRHHGPGSARHVRKFLERTAPDIVLIEGPPEADAILSWVGHKELRPPVAILLYQPDDPKQSTFYPFAEFSPEWQAIAYAREKNIDVKFMDLPAANRFPEDNPRRPESTETSTEPDNATDPLAPIAAIAGFGDRETWWEHMFELRTGDEQVFEAVAEVMVEARGVHPARDERTERLREAYMRKTIRQAEREMFQNIAVICGAWHVPALKEMPSQKADNELLKNLPKLKVEATWIPWTHGRLSYFSGYGAGIASPGWYAHNWKYPKDMGTRWMAKVAGLFRSRNMDISVSHVIEAVRLAGSLAALRGLSRPGLEELNEATLTVLCNGEPILMELIHRELIVGNVLGEVPVDIPKPPLQSDIEKLQKRLRLPPAADYKDYTLDLRKDNDLERSIFLRRLELLEIKWGFRSDVSGKGTFKEQWRLQWDPAFSIDIIERGNLGNTVEEAAASFVIQKASEATALPAIGALLEQAIPADLPAAVQVLIDRVNNLAAASGDVLQLLEVIPGLVSVSRYGNVRKTDADLVQEIATTMIVRVCVSLPPACAAVDEDAAMRLAELFRKLDEAVNLLQSPEITAEWQNTLAVIAASRNAAPVIAGYSTRLLADRRLLRDEPLVRQFSYAMSVSAAPAGAAAWLEGFLKGSSTFLLLDRQLWQVVNNWVVGLDTTTFTEVLPLLRRTFSHFSASERRKLGEKVKSEDGNGGPAGLSSPSTEFDVDRAKRGIPVILQLLGIPRPGAIPDLNATSK